MRTPKTKTRPRKTTLASFPVPTAGLISNRNIAMPTGQNQPPGAAMLDNWFPTPQTVVLRRGIVRRATLPNSSTVKSVISYVVGEKKEIFAATDDGIWNVTAVGPSDDLAGLEKLAATNGDWVTVQFSTPGGTFLIGVNGVDPAFIYDGTSFSPLAVTFPSGSSLTTADLSYVWAYKQRIWFAGKESLDAWYLPVDSIAGQLKKLPLGGVFNRGGTLLWGQNWSLASGGDGGLSEQCVFTTTEGEVAAYQGLSPDDASSWGKVGVYNVGRPMGKKAFIRAGGDLVIATSIGFIPLGRAIQTDYAALGLIAVSQPIAEEWRQAVEKSGGLNWRCELWGEGSMTLIAPPPRAGAQSVVLVANSDSGAWSRFTGWSPTAIEVFQGRLYFGSVRGAFQEAWVGGSDEGLPYTGVMMPLFNDLGGPAQRKIAKFARVVKRSDYEADESVVARFDWDMSVPPAPSSPTIAIGNEWNNAIWNQSVWNASRGTFISEDWRSVGGSGYSASVLVQVTSYADVPLDVEIIRVDMSYEQGDIVT